MGPLLGEIDKKSGGAKTSNERAFVNCCPLMVTAMSCMTGDSLPVGVAQTIVLVLETNVAGTIGTVAVTSPARTNRHR